MNPLKSKVGKSIPNNEINMAVCCESVLTEIKIPKVKQVMINKVLSAKSKSMFPAMGKSSTKTLNNKIETTFTIESKRYGTAFESMTIKGLKGETSSISIVPVSFSYTIAIAVIITQTSIKTKAITPGTKFGAPFNCGLYSIFTSGFICNGTVFS